LLAFATGVGRKNGFAARGACKAVYHVL